MAQKTKEHRRSVTITRVVVDGKLVRSDTLTSDDTTARKVRSREISKALPYPKGTAVHIESRSRKINIRRSDDDNIRLNTTVFYSGRSTFTDDQWLDKLDIKFRRSDTGVIISSGIGANKKTRTTSETTSSSHEVVTRSTAHATTSSVTDRVSVSRSVSTGTGDSSVSVYEEKENISYANSLGQELTIYLPAGAGLDLNATYSDVSADHDLSDISISMTNGTLDIRNAGHAVIFSTYSNISADDIVNGNIRITNGRLSIKNANRLQVESRYAKIDAVKCDSLQIKSLSDDYDIDEAGSLVAEKTYGSLRIDKLTGSLDLKGSSADVRIRRIDPTVSLINIDDRYADVALPVSELKNYTIAFSGAFSSVFAPFDKKDAAPENEPRQRFAASGSAAATTNDPSSKKNQAFTAVAGDVKNAPTVFRLACDSCNVDFK